jgi:hypothetical protein
MHEYNKRDIHECLHNRKLVFIGDSTTRQIFWAVAKKMDKVKAEEDIADMLAQDRKHMDLEFEVYGVKIQFIWDPWLNSTGLNKELKKFSTVSSLDPTGGSGESAAVVLLGAPGLWHARHNHENYMKDFRDAVERVIPYMDHDGGDEDSLHRSFNARQLPPNLLLMAPIQVPQYDFLSPSRAAMITPEKVDQMNDFLQQASAYSNADIVWSYNLMTWDGRGQYEESGLHVVENVAHRKADVLLNLRCNAGPASSKYPFDRTCCSNYTHPNHIQRIMIFAGMLVFPILLSLRKVHVAWLCRFLPSVQALAALTIFCLVICFSYYADRTQIFEKSHKQFRQGEFGMACFAVGIAGLTSIRKTKSVLATPGSCDQFFLSRNQSDEWKGWMQFFILIYHYTHGSNVLWIYKIVRLLIASYLFMTGFGHAMYFLKTRDYSSRRVVGVLFRLNLLSCVLPYMVRTDYMFYYFSVLVSFWFLIIYVTLAIGHNRNSKLTFLFAKIILSATLVTCFVKIPSILESILLILNKACGISWNVAEWRFRISLDLYVVYVGMIMAAVVIRRSQIKSGIAISNSLTDKAIQLSVAHQIKFNLNAAIVSIWSLTCFWTLAQRQLSRKEDYNQWQPYVSLVPILSFVALRNCCGFLRKYHSVAFAWLGRCSLETYILQYHIWLAGDTKGLLSLGLGSRLVDALVLTPIFLWISWHTANVTQVLTIWTTRDTKSKQVQGENVAVVDDESPYLLSRFQDASFVLGHSHTNLTEPKKRPVKIVDDLRWRICIILLLMWLANVTYR